MQIYRLENADGVGPYIGLPDHIEQIVPGLSRGTSDQHPSPHYDGFDWSKASFAIYGAKFGFVRIEQLHEWFTLDQQTKLKELGFHLTIYEVPEDCVAQLNHQCAFDKTKGVKVVQNTEGTVQHEVA